MHWDLTEWMIHKNYSKIEQFRGLLSQDKHVNPALYERVQFMKHFSKIE
jgi:dihydroorotate dehydrogenase (fumarate)